MHAVALHVEQLEDRTAPGSLFGPLWNDYLGLPEPAPDHHPPSVHAPADGRPAHRPSAALTDGGPPPSENRPASGGTTDPDAPGSKYLADVWSTSAAARHKPHDPILFVYGYDGTPGTWTTMINRFRADGWSKGELWDWSYDSHQSNAVTGTQIAQAVDFILSATGAAKVDIITHSMGSLSARYYTRFLGGSTKVDALVSLGGPNHGTTTAYVLSDPAGQEMQPGSSFLTSLNALDETWGPTRYATWWSPTDKVINPDASVPLAGAHNTETAPMGHSQLHEDPKVYAQVRNFVAA